MLNFSEEYQLVLFLWLQAEAEVKQLGRELEHKADVIRLVTNERDASRQLLRDHGIPLDTTVS